ncbi:hypothetical protein DPMN_180990 [Dreissena polymorpha]|uniref:Uncharacterized protein n=1 Tax=Dreissena polymorpha TaxID=45954 RepID=A0A9D4DCT9_DREPO|nr:hypothetical protein DPMN_180990 [Dreissena polymorpha]
MVAVQKTEVLQIGPEYVNICSSYMTVQVSSDENLLDARWTQDFKAGWAMCGFFVTCLGKDNVMIA